MKKLLFVILLSPLFVTVCYADNLVNQAAEMAGIYEVENTLTEDEKEISGALALDGSYDGEGALRRLWRKLWLTVEEQLKENLTSAVQLSAVGLFCSLLCAVSPDRKRASVIEIGGCCIITLLLAGNMESLVSQATETLTRLSDYSRAAIPAIYTAAAFTGAVTSASAQYAAVCLAMDVIMSAQQRFVLPLLYAFLAVAVSRSIFANPVLNAVLQFFKWSITTVLTAITLCFSVYISITGLVAGSADAVAVKAARTAISGVLPVVGGILSDSASTLLSAASVIKNAAGAFSLVAVCTLCLGPFAALGVRMLLFKMAAAMTDMLPTARISQLIGDFAAVFAMLLGMVGSCGIMLFLSIMAGIKVMTV